MKSKEKKTLEKQREEILIMVPSFINQVLLLMNSGMILPDALTRIAEQYESMEEKRQNCFTREICLINKMSQNSGENIVILFYQFSRRANVKELNRVANIMVENMNRGTALWNKLAEEGEMLWQERKRIAMEKMRISESKMSFPLGLLLVSLLLLTAGPAFLQMK